MNLAELDGRLREAEGLRLQELARHVPAGHAIVEVGSYRGKSTCYLATGSREGNGAHVYAVDLWTMGEQRAKDERLSSEETWRIFNEQVEAVGVSDLVTPIMSTSIAAAQSWQGPPIGLLFLDADHRFDSTFADYLAWSQHVPSGGVIAFHDYADPWPGVQRTIDSYVIPSGLWTDYRVVDRVWSGVRL